MAINIIGVKKFSSKDQKDFAKISFDYNPIHIDPIKTRRLISGHQIVHGTNILLTALNFLFKDGKSFEFNSIGCEFIKAVNINEKVNFIKVYETGRIIIEIKNQSTLFTKIVLEQKSENLEKKFDINNKYLNRINKINKYNINSHFNGLKKSNQYHEINLNNFNFSNKYKNLKNIFGKFQFKTILSLSYFVGMVYPGLNSILSTIHININDETNDQSNIKLFLKNFDKRFNLLTIVFSNNLFGEIKAFFHPGKVEQASLKQIKKFIKPKEFSDTNSLIIGGSRGLGELTAKILASGNGRLTLTYFQGNDEVKKLKKEIQTKTQQDCQIVKFNILKDKLESKIKDYKKYDFIYYFATPKISKKNENFDKKEFKYFYEFYVKKFSVMCKFLEKNLKKQIIVFYPSTVFIKQKPQDLKEYVKAKLLAENTINKLNRKFTKVKIISNRLPKLKTDQTAGIISSFKDKNIQVMIPVIRSLFLKK